MSRPVLPEEKNETASPKGWRWHEVGPVLEGVRCCSKGTGVRLDMKSGKIHLDIVLQSIMFLNNNAAILRIPFITIKNFHVE